MVAATMATCMVAVATAASATDPRSSDGPRVVFTAGRMNMANPDEGPWSFGIEYRSTPRGPWKLIPTLGLTLADDGAGFAYGTLQHDFHLGERWFVTPIFGAGVFWNGRNLDLGYPLEFKSALELSYRVDNGYRIGLLFYHLSNASLSEDNPGTEVVELSMSVPID
jgi:hypothetical protein